jgi:hypothetical protein
MQVMSAQCILHGMFPDDVIAFSARGGAPLVHVHSDAADNWALVHGNKRCRALGTVSASKILKDLKPAQALHPFHATVVDDLRCGSLFVADAVRVK